MTEPFGKDFKRGILQSTVEISRNLGATEFVLPNVDVMNLVIELAEDSIELEALKAEEYEYCVIVDEPYQRGGGQWWYPTREERDEMVRQLRIGYPDSQLEFVKRRKVGKWEEDNVE